MRWRRVVHGLVLLGGLLGAGCEGLWPDIALEQMKEQNQAAPSMANSYLGDGRALRPPSGGALPEGGRPKGANSRAGESEARTAVGLTELREGRVGRRYAERIPLPLSRALIDSGRERFEIYCAVCHGVRGDGTSAVAPNMDLRPPPSLLAAPALGVPPGRVYQVISEGYGFMPRYAQELSVNERWAVVAYLRALQLSQAGVRLETLPVALREAARRALP